MMNTFFYRFLVFCLAFAFFACDNEDSSPKGKYDLGMLVINEGNFSSSDGEVSFVNIESKTITNNIFEAENLRPFAGLIQNATFYDNKIFMVSNRADKVEIVEASSFKSLGTFKDSLINPIDFAAVGNKGYITNWGNFLIPDYTLPNSFVVVMDLKTNKFLKKITINDNSGNIGSADILAIGNKVFVANSYSNTITVINAENDQVIKNIGVDSEPNDMFVDKNGKLWVVCGQYGSGKSLVRINPNTNNMETMVSGSLTLSGKAEMNNAKDSIYYLAKNNVYAINISATTLPTLPFIEFNPKTKPYLYGIGVDKNGLIYVSNASFSQSSTILRFQRNGGKLDSLLAGKGANGFIAR